MEVFNQSVDFYIMKYEVSPMVLYIASQDASGGILRCRLTESGQIELLEKYKIDRPSYLCKDGQKLYALLREPFLFQSGVAELDILPDGTLKQVGDIQPTFGTISAFVLSHRGHVYTANYCSSSTSRLPDTVVPHPGRSVHLDRQTCSHPHCITATPDGDLLCICDLGTDCIYVCDLNLNEISRVTVTPGSGPRHLIFSKDGRFAYASNEMGNTVGVFSYEYGRLTHLKDFPTLPSDFTGFSTASAIRLSDDGRKLYVSNRGHDSVTVFHVDGAELTLDRFILSHGSSPREMTLAGNFLLCGNENSHTITVFDLEGDTSKPLCTFPVTRPWCILPFDI